jgi:hypothetical protein
MKTEEDEAFDDLARRQGMWGGGFPAKRQMAADKQEPWNEDEWRRNNWRCQHGWLRGEQCEICNAAQPAQEPPSEWEGIKAILDEYGLQAIDFVADFKAAVAQPAQDVDYWIREATAARQAEMAMRRELEAQPAQEPVAWIGLTNEEIEAIYLQHHNQYCECESPNWGYERAIEAKLKEKNT